MRAQFRPALVLLLLFTGITGILYPLATTGIATLFTPARAVGRLIAQPFTDDRYFHPRTSAAAADASLSSGTNLGPTNPVLADSLLARAGRLRAETPPLANQPIPADLLTASGSGLDPDISPEGARWQAHRVAAAREIAVAVLDSLVTAHTAGRLWGLFGEPRVNVLAINLALDSLTSPSPEIR